MSSDHYILSDRHLRVSCHSSSWRVMYVYVLKVVSRSLEAIGDRFHGHVSRMRSSGIRSVSVTVPKNQVDYCFS